MELESLDGFPLLAEGGQSKIYHYGDTKILRVPQRPQDYGRIAYEFEVYRQVEGKLTVPRAHEIVTYRGAPCLVMEKLPGRDWYSGLGERPLGLLKIPSSLAFLHAQVLRTEGTEAFETNHGKARYCIEHSPVLRPEIQDRLLRLLSTLETGTTLCHGDFHPGNLIDVGGKTSIIDWSSATTGSPLFDIAHTYLLLINTPRLAGVSDQLYRKQRFVTRYIGKRYLRKVCHHLGLSPRALFPYLLIKAGERSFYGMANEKAWLCAFIDNTLDRKGIHPMRLETYA
jgi:aminoglycoside phosphotransferase (APT) family kinase protein